MLAMSPAEGYKPTGTPLRLPLPLVTVTFPEEPFHFSAVPTAPRLPVENPTIWLTMNGVAVAFCATNAATVTAQANAASPRVPRLRPGIRRIFDGCIFIRVWV